MSSTHDTISSGGATRIWVETRENMPPHDQSRVLPPEMHAYFANALRRSKHHGEACKPLAMSADGLASSYSEVPKAEELDEGNSDDEEEIDNTNYSENVEVSNLNAIGRGTNSTWGASVLTWLTNVASTFAQISPIFKFN